jgi:hypothetical protein
MSDEYVPKHVLLQQFTKILYQADLMGLRSPKELEYENQALSVLCAMHESSMEETMRADERLARWRALEAVSAAFVRWFGKRGRDAVACTRGYDVAEALLNAYVASYPTPSPAKPAGTW